MISKTSKQRRQEAENRRLQRNRNELELATSLEIIAASTRRANGDANKMPDLLNEFIRDEVVAFGDRLHQQIVELLESQVAVKK